MPAKQPTTEPHLPRAASARSKRSGTGSRSASLPKRLRTPGSTSSLTGEQPPEIRVSPAPPAASQHPVHYYDARPLCGSLVVTCLFNSMIRRRSRQVGSEISSVRSRFQKSTGDPKRDPKRGTRKGVRDPKRGQKPLVGFLFLLRPRDGAKRVSQAECRGCATWPSFILVRSHHRDRPRTDPVYLLRDSSPIAPTRPAMSAAIVP